MHPLAVEDEMDQSFSVLPGDLLEHEGALFAVGTAHHPRLAPDRRGLGVEVQTITDVRSANRVAMAVMAK